jgi:hypothetical protein
MKMFKIYLQTDISQWDHEEVPKAEQHMTVDLAWLSPQCAKLCNSGRHEQDVASPTFKSSPVCQENTNISVNAITEVLFS